MWYGRDAPASPVDMARQQDTKWYTCTHQISTDSHPTHTPRHQTTGLATAVRENGSRIHGIESAVVVNADGAAARIRAAGRPPHLLPRRGSGTTRQPSAPRKRCVPSHCSVAGQSSRPTQRRGKYTKKESNTLAPHPHLLACSPHPSKTAANRARLVLCTSIPTASNHRVRRPLSAVRPLNPCPSSAE